MADEDCDRDDRTIFVAGLSDKITEALLYELFFQAGPLERVSIPKDKETDRFKTFGFVTYKHLSSVQFAFNVFSGTKLFGKELQLKNRNSNRNREQQQQQIYNQRDMQMSHPAMTLMHGFNNLGGNFRCNDLVPLTSDQQKQLLLLAASTPNVPNYGAQLFNPGGSQDMYASQRLDNTGSHREHYVDRTRHHREENRSSRSKPYRRSRSRSPVQQSYSRNRSPERSSRYQNHRSEGKSSNYHRWGKR